MKHTPNSDGWQDNSDFLLVQKRNYRTNEHVKQRKRLPNGVDIRILRIQQLYWKFGAVKAIRYIRETFNTSIKEAKQRLDSIRFEGNFNLEG